jgi:folate-binding protein YgfZ
VEFLDRMRFMSRVEVAEVTSELALAYRPAAGHELVPRDQLATYAQAAGPACGLWAYEALRIARGEPRLGLDTDERTIPNEVGWIGTAVHMDKGCYRGQETVARVHNLGRPPRRLTLLHLDGSENRLPAIGSELRSGEKAVGFVGTSARHHELGPIALALVKRNVPLDAQLEVDGLPAAQEVLVDPAAQGRGLGRAVTAAGLAHLASRGVRRVILYVESDNEAAIATYSKLGFTHTQTHVQYARPE